MKTTPDFEQLFNTMMQLGKLMSQNAQETHEERNATMLQLMALQYLSDKPSATVSELGAFLRLSKSSTTQLIERLVKAGAVKRINDKEDRRLIRLTVTEKGEKEFAALQEKVMEKMKKIFSKIPAKDLKELIRIHTNLIDTLEKEQYA